MRSGRWSDKILARFSQASHNGLPNHQVNNWPYLRLLIFNGNLSWQLKLRDLFWQKEKE